MLATGSSSAEAVQKVEEIGSVLGDLAAEVPLVVGAESPLDGLAVGWEGGGGHDDGGRVGLSPGGACRRGRVVHRVHAGRRHGRVGRV